MDDAKALDAASGPIDAPQAKVAGKQPKGSVPAQDNRLPAEPAAEASLPVGDSGDAVAAAAGAHALPTGTRVEPERKNKKKKMKKRQRESEDHAVAAQPQSNDDSQLTLKPTRKKHKSVQVRVCSGVPGSKHTLNVAPTSLLYTAACKLIC